MARSVVVSFVASAAMMSVELPSSMRTDCEARLRESPITASSASDAWTLMGPDSTLTPSGTVTCTVGELTLAFPPTCTSTVSLRSTRVEPAMATSALPPATAPTRPAALRRKPRPVSRLMSSETEALALSLDSKSKSTVLMITSSCAATSMSLAAMSKVCV